ncbi:MAG: GuaB3 family IMP dehydrogenase-related protein [Microthrixaceae bacterium]
MSTQQIGQGKEARRGYRLADLSIVPSRRTRTPDEVDTSWQIDALRFDSPIVAAPTDGVVSPETAIALANAGALGVLHSEGAWCRHEDPEASLAAIAAVDPANPGATAEVSAIVRRLGEAPVQPSLVADRVRAMREAGATVALAVSPGRVEASLDDLLAAEPDLLVIEGTVVSAEHLAAGEPLNLKRVLRRLEVPALVGGCTSYSAALHLMRTGAAGVLVGVGPGRVGPTRDVLGIGASSATALADARAARIRHLDETGVYCHVLAHGGIHTSGDLATAICCGADAVVLGGLLAAADEAPAGGWNWAHRSDHPTLPRSQPEHTAPVGPLAQVLRGPAVDASGTTNLIGALARSMAFAGHATLKDFQKADLVITPEDER